MPPIAAFRDSQIPHDQLLITLACHLSLSAKARPWSSKPLSNDPADRAGMQVDADGWLRQGQAPDAAG